MECFLLILGIILIIMAHEQITIVKGIIQNSLNIYNPHPNICKFIIKIQSEMTCAALI